MSCGAIKMNWIKLNELNSKSKSHILNMLTTQIDTFNMFIFVQFNDDYGFQLKLKHHSIV